ncbi:hypothetical protein WOLCODRAFT_162907 [Wolfiporia cocos MD-104 SS10]|uniref:Uncharacterized protein n=1 Tax=Wolfiporia cocos (strain MD-104) TaxID=742152 RepID=A0A2H3JG98_WOLCO|nr:hypothetical protein WOLCODRAFT_162907 [Wolfiporia cocos MD-104 SS10]
MTGDRLATRYVREHRRAHEGASTPSHALLSQHSPNLESSCGSTRSSPLLPHPMLASQPVALWADQPRRAAPHFPHVQGFCALTPGLWARARLAPIRAIPLAASVDCGRSALRRDSGGEASCCAVLPGQLDCSTHQVASFWVGGSMSRLPVRSTRVAWEALLMKRLVDSWSLWSSVNQASEWEQAQLRALTGRGMGSV